jgi:hypothetical protein
MTRMGLGIYLPVQLGLPPLDIIITYRFPKHILCLSRAGGVQYTF